MITKFDKEALKLLRIDIEAALAPIRDKYGLTDLHLGNISYNEYSFRGKIEGAVKSQKSEEENNIHNLHLSQLLGFNKNIVGEKFSNMGRTFTVTRIDLKKRKFPIIALGDDGRSYKFQDRVKFDNPDIKNNWTAITS